MYKRLRLLSRLSILGLFVFDQTVELKSHRSDLFSSLPTTLGRIYEDAITGKKWFKTADLGSLNVTNDADLQFVAEVYMIKEIVNVVCTFCYVT